MGFFVRFGGFGNDIPAGDHLVIKIALIVLVIQVSFYYFDLYNLRLLRERKKMMILLIGALGFASVFLFFVYYLFPLFTVGRGMFIISQCLIMLFTFSWRLVYPGVVRTLALKERILIVGTGKLARIIKREVAENGSDEFEIAGFVDENREKLGKRI